MTAPPVVVQQCLYGYQDGHRLLAASIKLTSHDAARLLVASDLTPGLNQSNVDYLTGMPLQAERLYALMRTWSAPELPRPGCVWTHVMLIPLPDLARFVDLGGLRVAFRRPDGDSQDLRLYGKALEFHPESMEVSALPADAQVLATAERIFRTTYSETLTKILKREADTEQALFAVWSQQWPRLRRSFSFRTAVGDMGSPKELRIAMQFVTKGESLTDPVAGFSKWERFAVGDLFSRQPSDLRRFLWRYASDIGNGRDAFPVLVEVFLKAKDSSFGLSTLPAILDRVFATFPSNQEAQVLKSDLLSFEKGAFSRLPSADPIGIWRFLITNRHGEAWDAAFDEALDYRLDELLHERLDETLGLAYEAMHSDRSAGRHFLRTLAMTIRKPDFWAVANTEPSLAVTIARMNPPLLDSRRLTEAPEPFLLPLLLELPTMESGVVAKTVRRLLASSSQKLVEGLQREVPDVLYTEMAHCLANGLPASAWRHSFTEDAAFWLRPVFIRQLGHGRALLVFMQQISPESPRILKQGTKPWLELRKSPLRQPRQVYVETFLTVLALKAQDKTFHLLLADAFPVVYEGIMNREIPDELFGMLVRTFPDVPIWRLWDNCYRLTLAVGQVLARYKVPVEVVADKVEDRSARKRLVRAYNNDFDPELEPDDDFGM